MLVWQFASRSGRPGWPNCRPASFRRGSPLPGAKSVDRLAQAFRLRELPDPMMTGLLRQVCLGIRVTVGLSSASFRWIASACAVRLQRLGRLARSATSTLPMLWWLCARPLRNSVTAGLSSASFCWIASAARYDSSASAGLPVCRQQDADVVVAVSPGRSGIR